MTCFETGNHGNVVAIRTQRAGYSALRACMYVYVHVGVRLRTGFICLASKIILVCYLIKGFLFQKFHLQSQRWL